MNNNSRSFNFSPGPAVLPVSVLDEISDNLFSYQGSGLGVMELSHRSNAFEEILNSTVENIRELYQVPSGYKILFCTGGATNQFSMVPLNLAKQTDTCDYIVSGVWAEKAYEEGSRFCKANIAATSKENGFRSLPSQYNFSQDAKYLHFTSNNTIYGTQFPASPNFFDLLPKSTSIVCDASSDILSKPLDISRFSLIYAGTQKNLGIAGITLVIIREDLIDSSLSSSKNLSTLPVMLNYETYAKNNSLYNTIPTFPIYVTKLVTTWLKNYSYKGLNKLEAISLYNEEKAEILYQVLDNSNFFKGYADKNSRSLMNITFHCPTEELSKNFIAEADKAGFKEIKGYRSLGGVRASIYNAFPIEGVREFTEFMKNFAKKSS